MPTTPAQGPLAQVVPNVFKPLSGVTVTTEATVWTPASGKKFRLMGLFISASAAGNLTFKDGTGGTTIHVHPIIANTLVSVDLGGPFGGIKSATADNVLTCTGAGGATTISGVLWGIEE